MTYRLVGYRFLILVLTGGFGILAAAFLLIALDTSDRGLEIFLLLWIAGFFWMAYWFLVRCAWEIGIPAGSTLGWRSVVRRHETPTSAIRGISTPWGIGGAGVRRIDVDHGPSPLLIASPGLPEVIAMIVRARPDLPVQTSWYDRVAARFAKRTLSWRRL